MTEQSNITNTPDIYLSLDKILEDPKAAHIYLQDVLRAGNVNLAMTALQSIIKAERRKVNDRLDDLEKRINEIEQTQRKIEEHIKYFEVIGDNQ